MHNSYLSKGNANILLSQYIRLRYTELPAKQNTERLTQQAVIFLLHTVSAKSCWRTCSKRSRSTGHGGPITTWEVAECRGRAGEGKP